MWEVVWCVGQVVWCGVGGCVVRCGRMCGKMWEVMWCVVVWEVVWCVGQVVWCVGQVVCCDGEVVCYGVAGCVVRCGR